MTNKQLWFLKDNSATHLLLSGIYPSITQTTKDVIFYKFMLRNISQNGQAKTQRLHFLNTQESFCNTAISISIRWSMALLLFVCSKLPKCIPLYRGTLNSKQSLQCLLYAIPHYLCHLYLLLLWIIKSLQNMTDVSTKKQEKAIQYNTIHGWRYLFLQPEN